MTKRIASVWVIFVLVVFGVQISAAQGTTPPTGEIAFTSDRDHVPNIYLMNADGTNVRQLTHDKVGAYQPLWSPDGQKLLYERSTDTRHTEIMVIGADGSHSIQAAQHVFPITPYRLANWSPDSQWLLYIALTQVNGGDVLSFHRVKTDGTDDQLLDFTPNDQDPIISASFLPDGKHLLVDKHSGLYTANLDGSHLEPLTSQMSYPEAVSLQGQYIVGTQQLTNILRMDSSGNDIQTMFSGLTSTNRADFRVRKIEQLEWSPNDYYIWGLISIYPDIGTATPDFQSEFADQMFIGTFRGDDYWLHPSADGTLSWSTDSQWITYTTQDYQIAISQPIGTNQMILTSGSDNSQPAWRPIPHN